MTIENGPVEIADLPINSMVVVMLENPPIFKFGKPSISMGHGFQFANCGCLPEGNPWLAVAIAAIHGWGTPRLSVVPPP